MEKPDKPEALILVSDHCPHCHQLETLLQERLQNGSLGKLDVVNIEQSPEVARQYGVRSVPWLRLGTFIFDEALTPANLDSWIRGAAQGNGETRYISYLLERGKLPQAIGWIESGQASLKAVVPLLADTEAKINVRIGAGAILEHFEDSDAIRAVIPDLVALLDDSNITVRIDICHFLSLTHSRDAIEPLKKMLDDEDGQVRQVAAESIEALIG